MKRNNASKDWKYRPAESLQPVGPRQSTVNPDRAFYYAINLQINLGSRPEKISGSSLDTNAVQIVLQIIFVDRFMYNKLMLV